MQIKTTVGHVYVLLWNEGRQIKWRVKNEALKEMSGPKNSEGYEYCLRGNSIKCKYFVVDVVIQTKLDQIWEGNSGRTLV